MMRWVVGSSLKFRFLVVAVAAAMVLLGVGQLRQLPVDVFPEFAPPRVEIQTACVGLSASEVEALVTTPIGPSTASRGWRRCGPSRSGSCRRSS
jgi:Cu/Ag efflux pump CusA